MASETTYICDRCGHKTHKKGTIMQARWRVPICFDPDCVTGSDYSREVDLCNACRDYIAKCLREAMTVTARRGAGGAG